MVDRLNLLDFIRDATICSNMQGVCVYPHNGLTAVACTGHY